MRVTAEEFRVNSKLVYSGGFPLMDEQNFDDQLGPLYSSPVPIQDVLWMTYRVGLVIGMGGERGSGKSELAGGLDMDDSHIYWYTYMFTYVYIPSCMYVCVYNIYIFLIYINIFLIYIREYICEIIVGNLSNYEKIIGNVVKRYTDNWSIFFFNQRLH